MKQHVGFRGTQTFRRFELGHDCARLPHDVPRAPTPADDREADDESDDSRGDVRGRRSKMLERGDRPADRGAHEEQDERRERRQIDDDLPRRPRGLRSGQRRDYTHGFASRKPRRCLRTLSKPTPGLEPGTGGLQIVPEAGTESNWVEFRPEFWPRVGLDGTIWHRRWHHKWHP